jgi:hypothetical protein
MNGTKNFITHGKSCDMAVVVFRNGEKGDMSDFFKFFLDFIGHKYLFYKRLFLIPLFFLKITKCF